MLDWVGDVGLSFWDEVCCWLLDVFALILTHKIHNATMVQISKAISNIT